MSICTGCGADIIWCVTERGKAMPVDAEPVPDGNVELRPDGDKTWAIVHGAGNRPLGVDALHLSHFVTCPKADQFRRRK